jgi:Family of unknown function (DUF5994)
MESDYPYPSTRSTVDSDFGVPRIRLKPATALPGYVDGGWWPRSFDPVVEFPALITALGAQRGPVSRMAYNLATWGIAPVKLYIDGSVVRYGGFTALDPQTITVTGRDWSRMTLLLVPPDTAEDAVNAALARASAPNNIASVRDLLAQAGERSPVRGATDEEFVSEQRWETDGGRLCEVT